MLEHNEMRLRELAGLGYEYPESVTLAIRAAIEQREKECKDYELMYLEDDMVFPASVDNGKVDTVEIWGLNKATGNTVYRDLIDALDDKPVVARRDSFRRIVATRGLALAEKFEREMLNRAIYGKEVRHGIAV